jgi:hypothetical protein
MSNASNRPGPFQPMIGVSPDGNKLIIFTPGMGHGARDECDIVVNDFVGVEIGFDVTDSPLRGCTGYSVGISQGDEEALGFTIHVPSCYDTLSNDPYEEFSHFALSFTDDQVRIAAVRLRKAEVWLLNTER